MSDARVHYAVLNQRPGTTRPEHQPASRPKQPHRPRQPGEKDQPPENSDQPDPPGPNSVHPDTPEHQPFHTHPKGKQYQTSTRKHQACRRSTLEPLTSPSWNRPASVLQDQNSPERLLRKEVIQPHLPVRLPCYDLVPITSPTFDGSLPKVGPPASGVTDFRDLTGGVYKARERIHRSVADLRLLATPTSWGRVADPNPN
jgi:hypothetical protein